MTLSKTLSILLGPFVLLLAGCGGLQGTDLSSLGPATPEPTYYGKPTDYSSVTTASVRIAARFRYRTLSFNPSLPNKSSSNGLFGISSQVIPYAEFHIYDSGGNRIQQGETSVTGIVDFVIPRTAGTYTLKVFSRAMNNYLQASVLQDIYNNQPHAISKTFAIAGSTTSLDLSSDPVYAEADENISSGLEGGAFNIYYNIWLANQYIRTAIGKTDTTSFSDPHKWWVADKVSAYWKKGFNPYAYVVANSTSPLSYYSPGQSKLYILGGVNGNVKTADTDHFDNSVILHEYGHFLEDRYGFSSSPGGSHDGNFVIDPRLAWSEGWANYFQAAVRSYNDSSSDGDIPNSSASYFYVDTFGYKSSTSDSGGGISIAFNLNQDGTNASYDNISGSAPSGEGVFREVSIARSLYKFTRKATVTYATSKYGGGIPFADIWKTFSGEDATHHKTTTILANSLRNANTYPLPNAGLFNKLLNLNLSVGPTNMNSIISEEKSLANESEYGARVTAGGSSCSKNLSGIQEAYLGSIPRSSQIRNNDFFLYIHSGAANTLSLEYRQLSGGSYDCTNTSCVMDLDLILYRVSLTSPYTYFEDYYIGTYSSADIVSQKRTVSSLEEQSGGYRYERISMGSVPAGAYLINVKLNAYNKGGPVLDGTVQYNLRLGSQYLCP